MDVSKLFFSVAPPEGGYYAIDKRIYDHVLGDDPVAYAYYKYTEYTDEDDGITYIIVEWNKAEDVSDAYDFYNLFADYWGEYGWYGGGFSTIENHQG